ncbi:MAG: GNAT family N-acetyltransferase [Thermoplasmata archaeon]
MDRGLNPKVEIRRMKPSDCKAAGEFCGMMLRWVQEKYLKGAYPGEAMEFDIWNHSAKRLAEDAKCPDFFAFLALHRGEICGIVRGMIFGKSGLAKFTFVAVHPEHQHEGIGIRLMTAAEEHLRRKGCHKIFVNTLPALIPATKLYMKFGLLPDAYLRKHWWGVDFLLMSKWIGEYRKV